MNCFSVDVEGFVESNRQSIVIDPRHRDRKREMREIERNMDCVLTLLDEFRVRGTFFFLGTTVRDIPDLVRRTASLGHEVGSHSYVHERIFGLDRVEFREKLREAKSLLEDLSGAPCHGFRAPDFSITKDSSWALDVLRDLGFIYDTSIYPYGCHDVYGIHKAQARIHRLANGLIEFPLSTATVLGLTLPFGGGGYYRLYPLFVTKRFIARNNARGLPCMVYLHPYEVGPDVPQVPGLSLYRRFRHYHHTRDGHRRLRNLLGAFTFGPAIEILRRGKFLKGV